MPEEIARQLAPVWESFADNECKDYSPLYDEICRAVARDDEVLRLASEAPLFGRQPNVLLAAVHFLLLRAGDEGGLLGDVYAGRVPGAGVVGPAFCELVLAHRSEVADLLATRRTNTNECGRSALLVPALRWAAGVVGEPLSLVDVGASAGLNLNLDRYRIDYGPGVGTAGPASSPVVIEVEVEGGSAPPVAGGAPAIVARCGLDRAPVDLSDPDDVRWQLACVWPDTGRLERTRAALALAVEHPPLVVAGDAVDDLATAVAEHLPEDGPLCVVTTWTLAYLRRQDRPRFESAVASLSSPTRAVVWISAEAPGVVEQLAGAPRAATDGGTVASVLGAIVYRAGEQDGPAVALGLCHPHGSWLRWLVP